MPTERISMRRVRELIRLSEAGLSVRQLAGALRLSVGAVSKYGRALREAGLTWAVAQTLDDSELERRLFGAPAAESGFAAPDCAWIHHELKRHRSVTLKLLWEEYREQHGAQAYRYSAFCTAYRGWQATLRRSMRQRHYAGEKLFVDYAGPTIPIIEAATGAIHEASLFVAAWGASNYTYAEATRSQQLADWLGSHVRAFEYFGGVPQILVPDNPKTGVTRADRYEPEINRSYQELAEHYGTVVIPARPYKPRDKAKVEAAVLVAERWILARLRHRQFFALEELNVAIAELLGDLNDRPFAKLPGDRRSAFAQLDAPAMRPLPRTPYVFAQWKRAKVGVDYHCEVDFHYYSVPHALVGREVEVRYTAATVECFHRSVRVASHVRSYQRGAHTTLAEHMPKSHRAHAEWSPRRLLEWGARIGPNTAAVVDYQLTHKPHPEQGYRACLGLLALARHYGETRLEAACARAVALGSLTRRSVRSILIRGLDRVTTQAPETAALPLHENLRGPDYYH